MFWLNMTIFRDNRNLTTVVIFVLMNIHTETLSIQTKQKDTMGGIFFKKKKLDFSGSAIK